VHAASRHPAPDRSFFSFFSCVPGSKPQPPNPNEVDLSHFELLKVVGKGGFGKVNAITKLDTQELMALKRMEKYAVLQSASHLKMVWIERKIMSLTNSPFLCNLLYAFESDRELFLVMPFMQGGDLRFHLKERGTMPPSTCLFYACEMILGLQALHEKKVVFRDLKPGQKTIFCTPRFSDENSPRKWQARKRLQTWPVLFPFSLR
jgi:serine/threonine protein kinase